MELSYPFEKPWSLSVRDRFGNVVFLPVDSMSILCQTKEAVATLLDGKTFHYRIVPVVSCKHCGGGNLRKLDTEVPEEFIDAWDDDGNRFFCIDCDRVKNAICRASIHSIDELPRAQTEDEIAERWNAMEILDNPKQRMKV